jgi:hypothetical protein
MPPNTTFHSLLLFSVILPDKTVLSRCPNRERLALCVVFDSQILYENSPGVIPHEPYRKKRCIAIGKKPARIAVPFAPPSHRLRLNYLRGAGPAVYVGSRD